MDNYNELADAQDRFSRIKHILLGCIDGRRQLRAELKEKREKLEFLEELCHGPQPGAWIDEYWKTRHRLENMEEEYAEDGERIQRLQEALTHAEDELCHMKRRLRRQQEEQRGSTTRRYHYYSSSSSSRGNESSYSGRSERFERSGPRHYTREANPDSDSSSRSRRLSMPRQPQPRYEYRAPEEGSSSRSTRPSMPYGPQPRYEYRHPDTKGSSGSSKSSRSNNPEPRHGHRRAEGRHHYSDRQHTSYGDGASSGEAKLPPRPESGPRRTPPPSFPPSQATISDWRKCVDTCFADYSKIRDFPHPPVVRDDKWEHNLKVFFLNLRGYDLKRERLRWHPDRFSACRRDKQEAWKEMAKAVFVVMNQAMKERDGE